MILELLQWAELASAKKVVAAQIASNLILLGYLLTALFSRKAVFLMAFILSDAVSYSIFFDDFKAEDYYSIQASIYIMLYFYIKYIHVTNNKTLSACVMIVLFELGMALDAFFYPEIETAIYNSHTSVIIAIHCYLIYSLIDFRKIINFSRLCVVFFRAVLDSNYNVGFVWYTLQNVHIKKSK